MSSDFLFFSKNKNMLDRDDHVLKALLLECFVGSKHNSLDTRFGGP
jgi:hypothetical protein